MQKTHTHLEAPECFRHLYSSEKERERERGRGREREREREREDARILNFLVPSGKGSTLFAEVCY